MKIAYLMNSYPMTSTTFIRREIHALEELGVNVKRFAVRAWSEQLVDPRDIDERGKTTYLLTGNGIGLLWSLVKEIALNPWRLAKAVAAAFEVWRAAGRDFIKHFAYLLEAINLRQRLRAEGLKHVHVHFATNATTVAMLCRVLGGSTYSFTVHGPDELVEPYRLSYDLKVGNAAFVAAISNFCRVQLARFGGAHHWNKIEIVPCALDLEEFEPDPNAVFENDTFVCIGRLCHQKAQALIPDAIEPLACDFPDLKIILVGDGETREEIEDKIAKKGLGRHFELVGWRSNEEVRSILKGARAMLLPSFAEGLPVSIMEAFALGRPVISTYIAGIPELVDGSCGWMVPAGDVEGLTAALKECLKADERTLAKMGEIGRSRVEARHDIRRSAAILRDRFEAHAEPERGADSRRGVNR